MAWYVDDIPLSTMSYNVSNRGASWTVPAKSGTNIKVPGRHGAFWLPNKTFDEGMLSLAMWAVGSRDGFMPPTENARKLVRDNLDKLSALFGQSHKLLRVEYREDSLNHGMENSVPNPKFVSRDLDDTRKFKNFVRRPWPDFDGEIVQATGNSFTNPRTEYEDTSVAPVIRQENLNPDPRHEFYTSAEVFNFDNAARYADFNETANPAPNDDYRNVAPAMCQIVRSGTGGHRDNGACLHIQASSADPIVNGTDLMWTKSWIVRGTVNDGVGLVSVALRSLTGANMTVQIVVGDTPDADYADYRLGIPWTVTLTSSWQHFVVPVENHPQGFNPAQPEGDSLGRKRNFFIVRAAQDLTGNTVGRNLIALDTVMMNSFVIDMALMDKNPAWDTAPPFYADGNTGGVQIGSDTDPYYRLSVKQDQRWKRGSADMYCSVADVSIAGGRIDFRPWGTPGGTAIWRMQLEKPEESTTQVWGVFESRATVEGCKARIVDTTTNDFVEIDLPKTGNTMEEGSWTLNQTTDILNVDSDHDYVVEIESPIQWGIKPTVRLGQFVVGSFAKATDSPYHQTGWITWEGEENNSKSVLVRRPLAGFEDTGIWKNTLDQAGVWYTGTGTPTWRTEPLIPVGRADAGVVHVASSWAASSPAEVTATLTCSMEEGPDVVRVANFSVTSTSATSRNLTFSGIEGNIVSAIVEFKWNNPQWMSTLFMKNFSVDLSPIDPSMIRYYDWDTSGGPLTHTRETPSGPSRTIVSFEKARGFDIIEGGQYAPNSEVLIFRGGFGDCVVEIPLDPGEFESEWAQISFNLLADTPGVATPLRVSVECNGIISPAGTGGTYFVAPLGLAGFDSVDSLRIHIRGGIDLSTGLPSPLRLTEMRFEESDNTLDPRERMGHNMTVFDEVRKNWAVNPSFEGGLDQGTRPHGTSSKATVALDTIWADTGSQSVRIDPIPGQNEDTTFYPWGGGNGQATAAALGIVPGGTYTIGATIHLEEPQTGTEWIHARRIRVNRVTETTEYDWVLSDPAPNEPGDHRVSVTFTVPEGTSGMSFCLCNGSQSGPVWWDSLTFEHGVTDGSYFVNTTEAWRAAKIEIPTNYLGEGQWQTISLREQQPGAELVLFPKNSTSSMNGPFFAHTYDKATEEFGPVWDITGGRRIDFSEFWGELPVSPSNVIIVRGDAHDPFSLDGFGLDDDFVLHAHMLSGSLPVFAVDQSAPLYEQVYRNGSIPETDENGIVIEGWDFNGAYSTSNDSPFRALKNQAMSTTFTTTETGDGWKVEILNIPAVRGWNNAYGLDTEDGVVFRAPVSGTFTIPLGNYTSGSFEVAGMKRKKIVDPDSGQEIVASDLRVRIWEEEESPLLDTYILPEHEEDVVLSTNLAPNPYAVAGVDEDTFPRNWSTDISDDLVTAVYTATMRTTGPILRPSEGRVSYLRFTRTDDPDPQPFHIRPVTSGILADATGYTITLLVRSSFITSGQFAASYQLVGDSSTYQMTGEVFEVTPLWNQYSWTFEVPEDMDTSVPFEFSFITGGGPFTTLPGPETYPGEGLFPGQGDYLDVEEAVIDVTGVGISKLGQSMGVPFSGSTPSDDVRMYLWEGEVNNSPSTEWAVGESSTDPQIFSWQNVPTTGTTELTLSLDYVPDLETLSAYSGLSVGRVMVISHSTLINPMPEYFDGDSPGGSWTGEVNFSPSVFLGGARQCWAEVQEAIDMTSMAGGTRAEFVANMVIPDGFWEDVFDTTELVELPDASEWEDGKTSFDLERFSSSTAPITDTIVTIHTSATSPVTIPANKTRWFRLVDEVSGAWIRVEIPTTSGSTVQPMDIIIDSTTFTVKSKVGSTETNLISKTTRGPFNDFFRVTSNGLMPPTLRMEGEYLNDVPISVEVTGRRKYFIS